MSHEQNAGQKYVVWETGEPCGTPACISLDKDISPSTEIEFSINYADEEVRFQFFFNILLRMIK